MALDIFQFLGDACHAVGIFILIQMAMRGNLFKNKQTNKQCFSDISLKSQELYLVVFITRYLDLFSNYISFYDFSFKIYNLSTIGFLVIYLRKQNAMTTRPQEDSNSKPPPTSSALSSNPSPLLSSPPSSSTSHWKRLFLPCIILALVTHNIVWNEEDLYNTLSFYDYWREYAWILSIYVESIAMVPQLILFRKNYDIVIKGNRGTWDDIHNYQHQHDLLLWSMFLFGSYRIFYIFYWIHRTYTDDSNFRHYPFQYFCGVVQVSLYSQVFRVWFKTKVFHNRMEIDIEELEEPLLLTEEIVTRPEPRTIMIPTKKTISTAPNTTNISSGSIVGTTMLLPTNSIQIISTSAPSSEKTRVLRRVKSKEGLDFDPRNLK